MTYAIVNPLLLPELLSSVASYLHPEERYTCSFVCKAWNTFFNYFVWETCIVDHSQIARSTFLVDDLRKHAHQIHNLTYRGLISPEHLSIQYPNLILLRIQFKLLTRSDAIKDGGGRTAAMNMWLGVAALIKNCSELTTVDLSANRNIPTTQIWEAIKDNPTVTNLRLHNVELNWKQEHAFWSACTTLEKLDMEDCDIQQDDELHQRIIPDSFPKLQDIKLRHVKIEPGDLIAMMANSPQLRSLDWRGGRKSNWFDVFNLKKRMMMNPFEFSNFESLNLTGGGFGDEELAELIQIGLFSVLED
ncbi:hypothetical protein BGX27_008158 [Mortierella sp. AM989]|nr:hypothetical protein BGX27_008158 [Mortierella sp. AM989]